MKSKLVLPNHIAEEVEETRIESTLKYLKALDDLARNQDGHQQDGVVVNAIVEDWVYHD